MAGFRYKMQYSANVCWTSVVCDDVPGGHWTIVSSRNKNKGKKETWELADNDKSSSETTSNSPQVYLLSILH